MVLWWGWDGPMTEDVIIRNLDHLLPIFQK
jgi:hypothetical protein